MRIWFNRNKNVSPLNLKKCKLDPKLAPVLMGLNRIGLKTKYSCQGHEGDDSQAYISFYKKSIKEVYFDENEDIVTIYFDRIK